MTLKLIVAIDIDEPDLLDDDNHLGIKDMVEIDIESYLSRFGKVTLYGALEEETPIPEHLIARSKERIARLQGDS